MFQLPLSSLPVPSLAPAVRVPRLGVSAPPVSCAFCAETTGGLTRSTRSPTRATSGRSPSPVLPTPRASCLRSCEYPQNTIFISFCRSIRVFALLHLHRCAGTVRAPGRMGLAVFRRPSWAFSHCITSITFVSHCNSCRMIEFPLKFPRTCLGVRNRAGCP